MSASSVKAAFASVMCRMMTDPGRDFFQHCAHDGGGGGGEGVAGDHVAVDDGEAEGGEGGQCGRVVAQAGEAEVVGLVAAEGGQDSKVRLASVGHLRAGELLQGVAVGRVGGVAVGVVGDLDTGGRRSARSRVGISLRPHAGDEECRRDLALLEDVQDRHIGVGLHLAGFERGEHGRGHVGVEGEGDRLLGRGPWLTTAGVRPRSTAPGWGRGRSARR